MKQQFRHQWVRGLTEMILIQFCSIHHILIREKTKKESGLITEWRLVLTHSSHSMTIPLQAKLKMEYYRPQRQLAELHNGSTAEFNLWEKMLLCMQGLCFACCCVRYLEFLVFLWPSLRSRNQNKIKKEVTSSGKCYSSWVKPEILLSDSLWLDSASGDSGTMRRTSKMNREGEGKKKEAHIKERRKKLKEKS